MLKPFISAFSRTNQNSLCPIQRFDTDIPMGLMELAACAIVGNEETVLFESSWRQQTSLFMNVHEHGIQVPERQRKCVRDVTQWLQRKKNHPTQFWTTSERSIYSGQTPSKTERNPKFFSGQFVFRSFIHIIFVSVNGDLQTMNLPNHFTFPKHLYV